jgi:atypical dual specificity phosphatase
MQSRIRYSAKSSRDRSPSFINNYIYIGNVFNAQNIEWLRTYQITHILNCGASYSQDSLLKIDSCASRASGTDVFNNGDKIEFDYMKIPAVDGIYDIIDLHGEVTFNFIEDCRLKNGIVLVHCKGGVNRSVAIVCAYLMRYENKSAEEIGAFLATKRGLVLTNRYFCYQLLKDK